MIFRLLVLLTLIIGQCIIAMEFSRMDTSAEMSQSLIAPSSKKQPVSSSFVTMANTKKTDSVRDDRHQEEHWIPITRESTATQCQIQSSQEKAVNRFESSSERGHRIQIPSNQESRRTQLEPPQDNLSGLLGVGTIVVSLCGMLVLFHMLGSILSDVISTSRH
ncbi:hypothetical protein MJO29_012545 [Puccinia striiformis f. sp. tritici]|uniref:Uncharacterized protein n=2 Tax=Puccinia striiformis TaxID=27350 RepID=A0A0L0VE16_9BASI|nr:hypothetical protein Pst134EB_024021 [Puccinia striiformis f. sp. tritici]KAI7946157.1 hypothetical protein MJO29_012545 [Puccinia striiformis f. sp. tritici]KAI9631058.1 hypothetical protein KEM48_013315 [Puccinia striiformis f. sp. tritici PST-130]KNE97234.1 hypothetical protein PSTG_09497 [Puccinia striiformis f. sp. tritici PST-78]POV95334.1 hypothetical protein PSHT_15711 [Puccinia striiformis]